MIKACSDGNFTCATELLQQGAEPNAFYRRKSTLHYGCMHGNLEFVKLLIETYKCDAEVKDADQKTPLHYACQGGHLNIVQYLINEHHCNPVVGGNTPNQKSPLYLAYMNKHMEIVQFLITQPSFNPDHIINNHQQTLLHCACQYGHLNIVLYLIRDRGSNPEVRDGNQQTPLHCACQYGHLKIVQYLISEQGCNPEVKDSYQQTPLYLACQKNYMEITQFLIKQKKDSILSDHSDQQALLYLTCQTGHLNVLQYLIRERGCNPEISNKDQQTPLHFACLCSHISIVRYLIGECGCNTDVRNKFGDTPLHLACQHNYNFKMIEFLLDKGKCNSQLTNNDGDTALHIACRNDNLHIVKLLIDEGKCDPALANKYGDTALHIACRGNSSRNDAEIQVVCRQLSVWPLRKMVDISIIRYLLEEGKSDPNLTNNDGQTPLQLTSDPEMIRELIRHGANPCNLNSLYSCYSICKVHGTKQPLQPPVKVFVVGNPCAGKSTLTAALKMETSSLRSWVYKSKVSGVDEKTAGVIPHDFVSRMSGYVTLYDFAGQPEFYSSHAALLQNAIQISPPIFLLVVDLCERDKEMKQTILYWLSFLENQCASMCYKSHVIIVGSHADVLRARGEDPKLKSSILRSLDIPYNLHLSGFIVLDCQYSESTGMSKLRQCFKNSCDSLRNRVTININAHCLFIYLLDKFRGTSAVRVSEIIRLIKRGKISANEDEPLFFLPNNVSALCNLCDELNDRGHILFLRDSVFLENSWIIIEKVSLLSEVTGTIFAPETFKQHCNLASSTGVVPVSNVAKAFPQHSLEILVGFLSHLEFCHEINDQEILHLASEQHQTSLEEETCSPSECYLLFPALISLDVPRKVWDSNPEFHYHCGWILQCCQPEQFFTTRFLQVLLLRLAFGFAFPHRQDFPALLRKCSLWKNGIYWGNRDGIETLVEVVEQNKAVIVLMRCPELTSDYLQLRSSVIQKVLAAADEFCAKVNTMESFIDPSEIIKYPLKPTSQLTLFSLTEIAEAIVNSKPAVVSSTGQTLPLSKLLVFEQDKTIFAGRNLLELVDVSGNTKHGNLSQTTRRVCGMNPHLQSGQRQLGLKDLSIVQTAIWDARVKWYNLGLELDIPVSTLEVIQEENHYKVDCCFTAMLKEWLKTNPKWTSLVEALKSAPVDYPQLAEEVFSNYERSTSVSVIKYSSGSRYIQFVSQI